MRDLLRIFRLLLLAAILILISLTSIHARPILDTSIPMDGEAGMTRLVAPFTEQSPGSAFDTSVATTTSVAAGTCVAAYATDIRQGSPTANQATENIFYVGHKAGVMRGLLLFNLTNLPPDVTVNRATLRVYLTGSYDYAGAMRTLTAHRVSAPWSEFLVTWNDAPSFAEAYGSVSLPHGNWGWYTLDVTQLVSAWLAGTYPNYGILLRGSENIAWRAFASDGTIYPPQLEIEYALPQQAVDVSPANVSFAIGSTTGTSPAQLLRRDTQTLTISSTTLDVLNWSATKATGAPWLNLDKMNGQFSAAEPDTIGISVVTDTLSSGIYTEQIHISSAPAVSGSPQTIDVTFWYTDGWHLNRLPAVLKNRSYSPHDYHTVALFIGISDYIYLQPNPAVSSDLRQPPKPYDLTPGLAVADATNARGMSIGKGRECDCCGSGLARGQNISPTATCGGGFRENNTLLLTEWRATKTAIRQAFRWLDSWEQEETLVFIAVSGHGGYTTDVPPLDEADGRDEFIVAAESAGTSDMAGVILDDELAKWLDELESNNIVMIFDTCFSGGMISPLASPAAQRVRTTMPQSEVHLMAGDGVAQDVNGPGRLIITASREDEASWEFGELEGGALSYFLFQALLDPATDTSGDGWISFEEVFRDAAPQVEDYVQRETGSHQHPQIYDGISGDVKWVRP